MSNFWEQIDRLKPGTRYVLMPESGYPIPAHNVDGTLSKDRTKLELKYNKLRRSGTNIDKAYPRKLEVYIR